MKKNMIIILLAAFAAFVWARMPDYYLIRNGKGGNNVFIFDDTIYTANTAGVIAKKGLSDTSKPVPIVGSHIHTYQWKMASTMDDADSIQYREGVQCSSSVLGAWISGPAQYTDTNNIYNDTAISCVYGVGGMGSYEGYFSRCDAVRFIMTVPEATGHSDTIKITKRGLKIE